MLKRFEDEQAGMEEDEEEEGEGEGEEDEEHRKLLEILENVDLGG